MLVLFFIVLCIYTCDYIVCVIVCVCCTHFLEFGGFNEKKMRHASLISWKVLARSLETDRLEFKSSYHMMTS